MSVSVISGESRMDSVTYIAKPMAGVLLLTTTTPRPGRAHHNFSQFFTSLIRLIAAVTDIRVLEILRAFDEDAMKTYYLSLEEPGDGNGEPNIDESAQAAVMDIFGGKASNTTSRNIQLFSTVSDSASSSARTPERHLPTGTAGVQSSRRVQPPPMTARGMNDVVVQLEDARRHLDLSEGEESRSVRANLEADIERAKEKAVVFAKHYDTAAVHATAKHQAEHSARLAENHRRTLLNICKLILAHVDSAIVVKLMESVEYQRDLERTALDLESCCPVRLFMLLMRYCAKGISQTLMERMLKVAAATADVVLINQGDGTLAEFKTLLMISARLLAYLEAPIAANYFTAALIYGLNSANFPPGKKEGWVIAGGVALENTGDGKIERENFAAIFAEIKFYDDAFQRSAKRLSSSMTMVAAVTVANETRSSTVICKQFLRASAIPQTHPCRYGKTCKHYHVTLEQVEQALQEGLNLTTKPMYVCSDSKPTVNVKEAIRIDQRLVLAVGTDMHTEMRMYMCLDSMANVSCTNDRSTIVNITKRDTSMQADCANGTPLLFTEWGTSRFWDGLTVQYCANPALGNLVSFHELGMLPGIRVDAVTEPGVGMTARVLDFKNNTVSLFTTHTNGLLACQLTDLCRPMSILEQQSCRLGPSWAVRPIQRREHSALGLSVSSISRPRSTVVKPTIIDPDFAKILTVKETERALQTWNLVRYRAFINPDTLKKEMDNGALIGNHLTSKDVQHMVRLFGIPLACRLSGFRNARAVTNPAPHGPTEIGAYQGMDTFFVRTRAGKLNGWLLLTDRTSKKRIAGKLEGNAAKDALQVIKPWMKWWNDRQCRISYLECDSHKGFKALDAILREWNIQMDFSTKERHSYLSESSIHGLRIRLRAVISSLEFELPDCLQDFAIQFSIQHLNYDTQTPLNSAPNFMVEQKRLHAANLRVGFGDTVIVAGSDGRTPVVGVVVGVDLESNHGSINVLVPSDDGTFDSKKLLTRTNFEAVCITDGIRDRMALMVTRDRSSEVTGSSTEVDVADIIQTGVQYVPMDDSPALAIEEVELAAESGGNIGGINQRTEGRLEISVVEGSSSHAGVPQPDKPYRPNRKGRHHRDKQRDKRQTTQAASTAVKEPAIAEVPLKPATSIPILRTSSGRPTKAATRFGFDTKVSAVSANLQYHQDKVSQRVTKKGQKSYGREKSKQAKKATRHKPAAVPSTHHAHLPSTVRAEKGYATNPRVQSLVATLTRNAPMTVDDRLNAVSKRQWVQKVVIDGLSTGKKCDVGDIHAFCNEMQMSYDTLFDVEAEADMKNDVELSATNETVTVAQLEQQQQRVARIAQIDEAIQKIAVDQADQLSHRHIAALIRTRSILIQQETGIKVDLSTIFDCLVEPAEGEIPTMPAGDMGAHYVFRLTLSKALAKYPQETIVALGKEFGQLVDYKVFTGVKLAGMSAEDRRKIIDSLLFLTEKMDDKGLFDCLKARLAARGDEQPCASHAPENSASTASLITIMVILTHAAKRGHVLEIADIKGAFLHPTLEKRIHMRLNKAVTAIFVEAHPEFKQFVNPDGTLIVQLNKAVYGLKEAAHLFQEHLSGVLIKLGWTRDETDPCLFTKWEDGKQCIVCTHVDDLLISHNSDKLRDQLIGGLEDVYGPLKRQQGTDLRFLGMHVRQFPEKGIVEVDQKVFIEKLQERFGIEGKAATPTQDDIFKDKSHAKNEDGSARVKPVDHPDYTLTDAHLYLSMVMCLMFLAKRTRGDILLPVCFLATKCQAPTMEDHYKLVRVFQYLNATVDMVLRIQPDSLLIEAFADASHNCHVQAQSHTGIVVYVGNVPVFMKSIKQKQQPAKSSTVAELYALHDSMAPVHRVQDILRALRVPQSSAPTVVWQDNTSTLRIVDIGHGAYDTTGSVNLRYFAIKHYVDQRSIQLKYKPTADMKADGLTKHFGGQIFQRNRAWLGVRNPV